ncbi:MAG: hypothetical protein HGA35_03215, partial [Erysipelotrichaceae bacterium]|nr:hypothetical protein [Erysipelotrichaceae bacterium]
MLSLTPYKIRNIELKNRIVMPPMCMYQASNGFVQPFHLTHYATRAIGNVGMIIVEATAISPEGRITDNDLGIWDDQFIPGLKELTQVFHKHGCPVFAQFHHPGPAAPQDLKGGPPIGPSSIREDELPSPVPLLRPPRGLTVAEIQDMQERYVEAAKRAQEAGFDGVEVHGANGYLPDQFLHDGSNKRTDRYGGSIENRSRFLLEIMETCCIAIGNDRVGV